MNAAVLHEVFANVTIPVSLHKTQYLKHSITVSLQVSDRQVLSSKNIFWGTSNTVHSTQLSIYKPQIAKVNIFFSSKFKQI